MTKLWSLVKIQQYIDDGIEESRILEYKSADALDGTPNKKKEIAKDVSAMANSAGGIIIYGVQEHQEKDKRHLPEKIDPIDRTQFSKERLEQIITDNIQPRIEGVTIHPVSIDTEPNRVIYVIEVPQSTTAHQITAEKDYRYYRRLDFSAVPMADYEIRDVMKRATAPDVQVKFRVIIYSSEQGWQTHLRLGVVIKNQGIKVINHYNKLKLRITNVGFAIGDDEIYVEPSYTMPEIISGGKNVTYTYLASDSRANEFDILITYHSTEVLFPDEELEISSAIRWGYNRNWEEDSTDWVEFVKKRGWFLEWVLYADDMPPKKGKIPIYELEGYKK